jgi:hypothetical protein
MKAFNSLSRNDLGGLRNVAVHGLSYIRPWHGAVARRQSLLVILAATATLLILLAGQTLPSETQQPEPLSTPNEYTVKAVLLYGFGRHVDWPQEAFANASDPFVIGILGDDPFGAALDNIAAKKTIQDRRIVVKHFKTMEQFSQPCHILFVSKSVPTDAQKEAIKKVEGKGVFIIGETPGFIEEGGIANFYIDGDSIHFEININAARRSDLRMDAKLQSLGKLVGS